MKSHAIEWTHLENTGRSPIINPAKNIDSATRLVSRGFLALVPALVLIVGSAWLITIPSLVIFLHATIWTSGLVFFGLALDSNKATVALSIATGFALPALALLSSNVSLEFSVVAATIVAAWLAVAVWRRSAS